MSQETRHLDRPLRTTPAFVRRSGEQTVVVQRNTAIEVSLNPTAFALWELCDGDTSIDEMVDAVCQLFTISRPRAERDVAWAVEQMRKAGLIT